MSRLRYFFLSFIVCPVFLFSAQELHAHAAQESNEEVVLAALNYNFAKYSEWPNDNQDTITLCYLSSKLGRGFSTLESKKINDKHVQTQLVTDLEQAKNCHAIFIDSDNEKLLKRLFIVINDEPILTVSDIPNFISLGGMVELYKVEGKFRFNINLSLMTSADLTMSTQVLKLAGRVK